MSSQSTPHPWYAIEQLVAEELGNSSYVLADPERGDALVIDPTRDVDRYLELAQARGWTLRYALDTHLHNDFLSGGSALAAAVGADHLHPYAHDGTGPSLRPGQRIGLGRLQLEALHTPGHTPEHVSFLLHADAATPVLFSGGALMVGTIARPDLLGPERTFELGRLAFTTVHSVLRELPDQLDVLPTHGGGSFCGASQSRERSTTLRRERRDNALLRDQPFLQFLARYANQGEFPAYYAHMAPRNQGGVPVLGHPLPQLRAVQPVEVDRLRAGGCWLIDVRAHEHFDAGSVETALNIGLHGPMSAWAGWVVPLQAPVLLIADAYADADAARRQLVRIGFDRVEGWLQMAAWRAYGAPVKRLRRGDMAELSRCLEAGERLAVVDVRQEREWVAGHLPGAVHALPPEVVKLAAQLPPETVVAVHCSGGYRSALAASLLARDRRVRAWHIIDGPEAWLELGLPLTVPGS